MFAPSASASVSFAVQVTPDLRRVVALPRRTWTEADAVALAEQLTPLLSTSTGTMTLRPIQAMALCEAAQGAGLLGSLYAGCGKTLLSLLAPYVLDAKRPLLLVPAKLGAKTQREQAELVKHWRIPNFIRIVSYEILGRVQSAELLERYQPDLIIADECHRLKNPRAAVTRRVMRFLASAPARLLVMSGTIISRSITDYAHLLRRALGPDAAPVPKSGSETDEWSDALDEKPGAETRVGTGALVFLCDPKEAELLKTEPLAACRRAFRRRLVETRGVVATTESYVGCSLSIAPLVPRMSTATDEAFRTLRSQWQLPDGQPLAQGLDMVRHARELALGFFYLWDPAAPKPWMRARQRWFAACRHILGTNRRNLDSPLEVANAVDAGLYPHAVQLSSGDSVKPTEALEAWRAIRESFRPNTVPVWIDQSALVACEQWAKGGPGVIWAEHVAFAEELSHRTGFAYHGAEGLDARGRAIESASSREVVIASVASNSEGRNLQKLWSRNLVTSPPKLGKVWEQLLARTHRDGQTADEVSFDVLMTCREHADSFEQARADARFVEDIQGQGQRLLYADVDEMPRPESLR